ncbi:MAG: pyridoxamine 5'-phosphate oxidase family protein [Thermodesulfobacteriota bacterium]
MAKMSKEVMDMFNDQGASKVLATVDKKGIVNVVPKGTLSALDDETVAFADIFGSKTNKNLEETKKATALSFKFPPAGYQVKGTFQGFQTSGPLFDQFAKNVKEKMKLDVKGVGTIKVDEVFTVNPRDAAKK